MLSQITNTATKYAIKNAPVLGRYALQIGAVTVKTAIGVATTFIAVGAGIKIAEKVEEGYSKLRQRLDQKHQERKDRELEKLRSLALSKS